MAGASSNGDHAAASEVTEPLRHRRWLPRQLSRLRGENNTHDLGDFTTTPRTIMISVVAIGLGALGSVIALILLRLIGIFTNLFFYGRWGTALVSPAGNDLGAFVIVIPIIGGVLVGLMARYGSEQIRGHGIPEALESILIEGSRVPPKVAFWKPLASALSIGTGGPFGAEGPIIVTGGATGSLIAQFLRLTSSERKTLLVAGAAAGMSATFAAPVASVLLAVEIMLFEWKPRSLIPVALASATATIGRHYLVGSKPLFPTPPHPAFIGITALLACIAVGLLAGAAGYLLTNAVYGSEDIFRRLPLHWMWWPAIGGLAIGIGGLIFPQALGVGYDTIDQLFRSNIASATILGILLVKSTIWAFSLGSGTSGGTLAPLLMVGGALGGLEGLVLPNVGVGFWPLISSGAVLACTLRSPLMGVIFLLELTHDVNVLLPLIIAVMVAYGFTVLTMRHSILTEKVARRGYHLSSEYAVDPLEILSVREVMQSNLVAIPSNTPLGNLEHSFLADPTRRRQALYPIVNDKEQMVGIITRSTILALAADHHDPGAHLDGLIVYNPIVAFPDEPLRAVIYRMAQTGFTRLPVVARDDLHHLLGLITLHHVLDARMRTLEAERRRERVIRLHVLWPHRSHTPDPPQPPKEANEAKEKDTSGRR